MQPDAPASPLFRFRRNASYLASVRLALRFGVWWAPTTLLHALRRPLLGILEGLCLLAASLAFAALAILAWTIVSGIILISGGAGFLAPADDNQS